MEKNNITRSEAQGAVVEYKGTTKDVFEVGCTYKDIKVIARNGNKLTIQHLRSTSYHKEGDIENKNIYLAGCEDTNFTEYIKWNYGYEVCALNKVEEQPTTEKDAEYGMVDIDWSNKDVVDSFIND